MQLLLVTTDTFDKSKLLWYTIHTSTYHRRDSTRNNYYYNKGHPINTLLNGITLLICKIQKISEIYVLVPNPAHCPDDRPTWE